MRDRDSRSMIPEEDAVTLAGGDGRTMGTAAVILGAPDSMVAVEAESGFLTRRFGARDVDWGLEGQHLQKGEDGRMFDVMNVVLTGGSREVVYFDITELFRAGAASFVTP